MNINEEIKNMIAKSSPSPIQITKASNLYTDLGFHSLDFVRLLLEIEEHYLIIFDLIEMENCLQLDYLIELVEKKVEEINYDPKFTGHTKR